ncbi:hypothetical protein RI543_002977 [Arxiozyma heterogenica]|uniref:Uncharacterized protein n=1 Tax=Arxiozyma heterogenica TaxID=278026 RepID=A0AAN7WPJ5_9SACH|nr:hypothetical protein RI543_002977 [Kazachstania heterogenica]
MKIDTKYLGIDIPDSILDFKNIPTATKYITGTYVYFSIILYISIHVMYDGEPGGNVFNPMVQLIPSQVLKYPYAIVTSNLIDTKLWKFIVTLINLLIGGTFIENNWNSAAEMFKFVLVVGSITNFINLVATNFFSLILPNISLDTPLDGNYSIIIGFAIIYKQLLPETTIIDFKYPFEKNFRFKLLPIFITCFMTITQLFWFHHFADLLSIWISFMCCWVYLRFFQQLPMNNGDEEGYVKGDASDTFELIYFFPDVIKPFLRPVFNWIYDLVVIRLDIITPFDMEEIDKGNDIAIKRGAKKITSSTEDRRRQLALQVLQERMSFP